MNPAISIIMPVRNGEAYLVPCLESILAQSETDWELIVVDDGSNDRTSAIIRNYNTRDKRIRTVINDGVGIIDAVRTGFSISNGTWITRMDADDLMPNDKLRNLRSFAAPHAVVTGKVQYFSDIEVSPGYKRYEKWLNELVKDVNHYDHLYRECVVASPNWLVHREFFDQFDWAIWNYPEDYDLIFQWHSAGYRIVSHPQVTHLWREHPSRTSRNSNVYDQKSFFNLKTEWFVKLILKCSGNVQVIGTGTKSRVVQQILKSSGISFELFDIKSKKGIRDIENLNPKIPAILTSWPIQKNVQFEIQNFLKSKEFEFGKNVWIF